MNASDICWRRNQNTDSLGKVCKNHIRPRLSKYYYHNERCAYIHIYSNQGRISNSAFSKWKHACIILNNIFYVRIIHIHYQAPHLYPHTAFRWLANMGGTNEFRESIVLVCASVCLRAAEMAAPQWSR